jgi:hypothetical protein
LPQLTLSGTVLVGAAGAPGTAQLVTQTSLGTLTFDVYSIDPSHLKFVETDGVAFMVGDAFPQQTTIPAATNVFTVAGMDLVAGFPFVAGGFIVTDGSSISNVLRALMRWDSSGRTRITGLPLQSSWTIDDDDGFAMRRCRLPRPLRLIGHQRSATSKYIPRWDQRVATAQSNLSIGRFTD